MRVINAVFIGLIHGYRTLVSPILPPSCRFEPSCSEFALQAVRCHGAFHGGWFVLRRLSRCHPWGGEGYDPVPEPRLRG
jgi:putative membrane protein insertion efficiency factor